MAVGAGEQNSPVSRRLARSTAPLERQGRAALEEDPAEESPALGGEQVERGGDEKDGACAAVLTDSLDEARVGR